MTDLREGSVFAGDFRIVRALARGGMGAVFVADQLSTGRQRALKVMLPALVGDETSRARFAQEARVGSLVESDHVVEVIAAGIDEASGAPWMAMELLAGETLHERVARAGPLSVEQAREVFAQLGHALSRAHAVGLVHRDLKPENLFLAEARRTGVPFTVKVLDFGIAKLLLEAKGRAASGTQALGSPLWMAPEQANAQPVSPSTDVWALGLIAFHALTGRSYWKSASREDANLTSLLVEMLVDPIDPPSARAAALGVTAPWGSAFDRVFARCVAREPSARFETAREAIEALHEALEVAIDEALAETQPAPSSAPPTERTPANPTPAKKTSGLAVALAIALGLGGLAALGLAATILLEEEDGVPAPETSVAQRSEEPTMTPLAPREEAPSPLAIEPRAEEARVEEAVAEAPRVEEPVAAPRPVASRPRPSRHAQQLEATLVGPCWRDSAPQPATRMRIELVRTGGQVTNLRLPPRWQGTPFARCVITRLPRLALDAEPPDAVVLALPATAP